MVVPFVMAGVLMALAFGAHIFVGTRETLSLRPVAHPANTENMVRVPANHTELSRHWTQNPVSARTCRFDPGRRYSIKDKVFGPCLFFFAECRVTNFFHFKINHQVY